MSPRSKKPLISRKEWRLFWLVTLGLSLVSGGGTALATWLGRPEEPKGLLPAQSPFKANVADTIPKTILLSDFDLPAPGGQWLSKSWLYSRDGGSRPWTWEEIEPYWTPVDRLSVVDLPRQNAQRIQDLLGSVP